MSESAPEDPELKRAVFARFDRPCPERTVFTTNTSSLIPSMFADATGRPDRFAALHFHLPVWSANVVDVMPHPGTAPEVTELLLAFAPRIGQIPIHLRKEHHGYAFNSMYEAMNREAIALAANRIALVEDVDRAWMGVTKMPVGPFGMLDDVGRGTVRKITSFWAQQLGDPQLEKNEKYLRGYVDTGRLGRKSGEGFYRYPEPAYRDPGFLEGRFPTS